MKRRAILLVMVVMLAMLMASCSPEATGNGHKDDSNTNPLVGMWYGGGVTLWLKEDGYISFRSPIDFITGTWSEEEGNLHVLWSDNSRWDGPYVISADRQHLTYDRWNLERL